MQRLRCEYPVRILCAVLRASVSAYYLWCKRTKKPQAKRERLKVMVLAAHRKTRATYGAIQLHRELLADNCRISLWKVPKLRRELGLRVQLRRRTVRTTDLKKPGLVISVC